MDAPRPTAGLSRARLASAWLLACAPLALGWFADTGVDRFAGVSFVALCGIPWVFVMGMPRTVGASSSFAHEVGGLALLLAPLAAAAGIDAAQGAQPERTGQIGRGRDLRARAVRRGAARGALALEARARTPSRGRALVAAPPRCSTTLEAGAVRSSAARPRSSRLARASPLGALGADVRDIAAPVHASIGGPLVLVLVASAAAWRGRAGEAAR